MFNQCLALAQRMGLKVIEGIEATNEAGGCPIDAGPIKIVDITRVY